MNYPKNRYRGPHPWTDRDWLYEEYIVKNRPVEDIAGEFGCAPATIEKAANKHGLKRPPLPKKRKTPLKPYEDKETLERLYFQEGKNLTEIGNLLGCSSDTIRVKMKGFGLPIKEFKFGALDNVDLYDLYVNQKLSTVEIGKICEVSHRTVRIALLKNGIELRSLQDSQMAHLKKELNEKLKDRDWLYREYVEKKRGAAEIGRETGHSLKTVQGVLKKFGIHVRNGSESKVGLMIGEKHPNWKGGVTSFNLLCREYYEVNIRPLISQRDGFKCRRCGKEHCRLHVHHIIPLNFIIEQIVSENSEIDMNTPDGQTEMYNIVVKDARFTDSQNMITLCRECHIEEHKKYSFRKMKDGKMKIKTFLEESFDYYKVPVMLIASPTCSFKCCTEANIPVSICQNSEWAKRPTYEVKEDFLIQLYQNNSLTKGIAFGGLEPFDQFEELYSFISCFRNVSDDDVVIYTGYKEEELIDKIDRLKEFPNIIIKFGRYVPNSKSRYDDVLGVTLASDNQYAKKIS